MPKNQGEGPGSGMPAGGVGIAPAAREPAYRLPAIALAVAAIGYGLTVFLVLRYPELRAAFVDWPPWAQRTADLVVLSAPLVAAVIVAGRLAAGGIGPATGIRRWRWIDPVLGALVAVVLRALVELVAPTTGSLLGPFAAEITPEVVGGAVVLVVGLVILTPLIEELFFRGLVLRALGDALRPTGRIVGPVVALLVSTAAFAVLHALPWGDGVPVGLLVGTVGIGLGCGILTILTSRLGAAIVAHVAFNAIGVAMLLA